MTTTVHCESHGDQDETFVCQHLAKSLSTGIRVGYWCAKDEEATRPDAWCSACEQLSGGGDWNEESEKAAGIVLLCGRCYDLAKAQNLEPAAN
jgi:hypothetical protein